ncbi:RagB/SusD family nutrient uptake outer membrane protein [Flavobacterium sp. '19STA2R22 D10 B1']|uniref:RagB/SusD family nutrient uptake outer membrane protein n=1 Tax=Flavobacterium aerium TaxID=3037261 RepID=UPI00278BB751|nr:RagB/SusD family nutrient uptake outer membrane protein [Flavobacterium sp. '19STA2R22 D10 B1']
MKKLINLTARVLLLPFIFLFIFSCEDFTETDMPQSQLTGPAVFEDVSTANAALSDIYARLREGSVSAGTQLGGTTLFANYADDMDFYGTNVDIEQFNKHTVLPSNTLLTNLWNTSYGEIYAVNALIEGVQNSTVITGEDRNRLLGEAMFIRAFIHFYLVNIYGDIPYITTIDYEANTTVSKMAQTQVYELIVSDLTEAETFLPESYPSEYRVRVSKAAALAMLARVYLYIEDYEKARNYATAVINNSLYSVEPNLALAFLKESPSIIWSFHPGIAGLNTKDARAYIFSSGPPTKAALAVNLRNAFESGDIRQTSWIRTITDGTDVWYQAYKYKKSSVTEPSQEYTIVLRIEEQHLIRAEARAILGDITGAQQDLNMTRNRAGLPNTTANTTTSLKAAILQERRFEFFCEQGHRWFDLKRTGNAGTALSPIKPGWQNTDVLLPLPETEILLNSNLLPQNPGY